MCATGTHSLTHLRYLYRYSRELYDLTADPSELHNILGHAHPRARQALHERLAEVWRCAGHECP